MENSSEPASGESSVVASLFPIILGIFVVYLVIGFALPIIPLHVHGDLGLGGFAVGLVAGGQFTASLISRFWSGNYADTRGGKKSITVGLIVAAVSGLIYWISLQFSDSPLISVSILLIGRAILGAGESFIVSGAFVWGLSLVGVRNTGKVMSWVGTAMYLAFAIGAPLGKTLYKLYGFEIAAYATAFIPLLTLLIVFPRKADIPKIVLSKPPFKSVINSVWLPGLGLAFSSLGFGAITTFLVLLFKHQNWNFDWLGLTIFATAFVLARLFLGHLADKIGGAKVALFSALIEAVGLLLVWLAPVAVIALIGAGITGFGYALVYPGFGVEAVQNTPAESRGLATGTFTAFLDLALGLANPALGLISDRFDLKTVFLVSAISVFISAMTALILRNRNAMEARLRY